MGFRHSKREPEEHGHSPGNGITDIPLSQAPMATEGEATAGPDDVNPYDEREYQHAKNGTESGASMPDFESDKSPTSGDDPFAFDDVDREIGDVSLPGDTLSSDNIQLPGDF